MTEFLKKPYEISIWKDKLVTDSGPTYFDEEIVAIIGSDTMTSPNRAFSPKLTKNVNGETTFTFSMAHRYYDNELGEEVFNPFTEAGFLVNERKIKLWYDGKWYDFIIKNCEENSEENTFTYECTDLWINELSKTGYNVELAQELSNNQGTILELADTVVESSDWVVDHEGSDTIMQWVQEPLFVGRLVQNINTIEAENPGETVVISQGEIIYFFYSEIISQKTTNVHILRDSDRDSEWIFDDNNVAKGPNYRITDVLVYDGNRPIIVSENDSETQIPENRVPFGQFLEFQGYRLNYAPVSKYDPVTEKYVDVYRAQYGSGNNITYKDIYHYKESQYTTSDVLFNYITNGSNFNVFANEVEGWYPYASDEVNTGFINKIEFSTLYKNEYTSIVPGSSFPDNLLKVEDTDGCIDLYFGATSQGGRPLESMYNSGIQDNGSLIGGFVKGEKYVFRAKYNVREDTPNYLGLIVAPYTIQPVVGNEQISKYQIDADKKYFDLRVGEVEDSPFIKNNIITGGHFSEDFKTYTKTMDWGDDVIPPSRKYVYYAANDTTLSHPYVWSSVEGRYVEKDSDEDPQFWPDVSDDSGESGEVDVLGKGPVNSWCIVGECLRPLSAKDIQEKDIGIFIVSDHGGDFYVREIEFFKYIEDANGEMMLLGSAPEARINELDYFYIPDENITEKDAVETFTDISAVADYLGISSSSISQVYNEDCEKIASVEAQESNYFNIIQDLCEKFECWAKFEVEHDTNGKITLDANNNPIKKISFHEYVGDDNFAGFKYGINLSSIQRTLDSNEFVSKLIVAQNANEYVDGGVLTIRNADANALGESYILNFSYYLNQGLIDAEDFYENYGNFQSAMKEKNIEINRLNQLYEDTHMAMTRIAGTLDVYREVLKEANLASTEGVRDIKKITGAKTYEAYIASDNRTDEGDEAVMDYLAKVLTGDNLESGYAGITKQLQDEYDELQKKADGLPSYTITISVTNEQTTVSISDFVDTIAINLADSSNNTKRIEFNSTNKIETFDNFIPIKVLLFTVGQKLNSYTIYDTNEQPVTSVVNLPADTSTLFFIKPPETSDTTSYKAQIDALKTEKDSLEKEFFKKYGRYIQEGTWTSDDYVDNNLYYLDALQVSNTSAQPNVTYTINVVEVSEIEGLSNYLFDVGDKTYIEDTEFFGWTIQSGLRTPIKEEVIVSEVEWNLDSPEENTITVQNYKTQFEDLFQRVGAAIQSIEYKESAYNRAASMLDTNGLINSSLLAASLNNISGSKFGISAVGAAYVDRDGIVVTDITKTINQMKLSSKGLMVSDDAGVTWRTIVSPDGIDIGYIKAGIIDVDKINIMDGENTSFRWDKNGISAYSFKNGSEIYTYIPTEDEEVVSGKTYYEVISENIYEPVVPQGENPNPKELGYYEQVVTDTTYDISTYVRFDKYGLYGIKNNGDFTASSVNDVEDEASFGITWRGFFIKNKYGNGYTSISEDDDIKVVKIVDEKEIKKIHIGVIERDDNGLPIRYGMSIRNDANIEVFKTDDDGNAVFNNVSIKGSLKAAVFEYEEIQAIGGIVIIRPSSTIKEVVGLYYEDDESSESGVIEPIGTEIIIENPNVFSSGDYCALGCEPENIAAGNSGYYTLVKYRIDNKDHWVLKGLYVTNIDYEKVVGSALVSMARVEENVVRPEEYILTQDIEVIPDKMYFEYNENTNEYSVIVPVIFDGMTGTLNPQNEGWYELKTEYNIANNYGIGINSSDSGLIVPPRSISLYTAYGNISNNEISGPLVFDYQAILGTLPKMDENKVSIDIYSNLQGTQGIFTDNMYIGNNNEYIAYYTYINENNQSQKKLSIVVNDLYINTGEGVPQSINAKIDIINNKLTQQNSHLLIKDNNITLYATNEVEQGYDDRVSGITLTSAGIQFFTNNEATNKDTWIDNESLNSQEIYFERMYPRSFENKDAMRGEGNLVAMGRKNKHFTIKNIR